MSEIKVNSIKGVNSTDAAITINNSDGTCTANLSNRQGKNLIINGAMQCAQYGSSSTTNGYGSVDRFKTTYSNTDEAPTQAQVDVASGTTPYTEGFRKALKVTNGNQTSVGGSDDISVRQNIESQNIAQSGWDYTSSSSFITVSFWVKSSVAQTFFAGIRLYGSDQREFCFSYALSADTWTKVTKSIPGAAGNSIVNSTAIGAFLQFPLYWGTDFTDPGRTVDTWQVKNNAANFPVNTTTWYTTNDATWEITGVQLEVGSVATDFEHRSFAQELQLCKRYYQQINQESSSTSILTGFGNGSNRLRAVLYLPVEMRANPTVALDVSGGNPTFYSYTGGNPSYSSLSGVESTKKNIVVDINTSTLTAGAPYDWRGSGAFITIAAEL